jgi:HK97 gp10 family phage protein
MKEFDSIRGFVAHLATLEIAMHRSIHRGLEKVAKGIEADAKSRIGHEQDAVGSFPAWEPLADSTEYDKARKGYPVDAPLLRDGTLRDSIKHEVEGLEAVIGSESAIAEYQEFGTPTIPPRPFIGPAAFANKDAIERILGAAVVEGLTGGQVIHESLGYGFDVGNKD